jgi:predicted amidohydrolase
MSLKYTSLFYVETRSIASLPLIKFNYYSVIYILIAVFGLSPQPVDAAEKTVKIAICQIQGIDSDREGNFKRIENAIVESKNLGAEIACFPETIVLGWVNPKAHQEAREIPGEDSDRLCQIAKKNKIFMCVGLAEISGDALYDSAILIDDEGKILLKHRKLNILDWLMDPPYTPGENVNVAPTKYGKIGILICADTFTFEPWANYLERMAELEPDIVLVPYGWAKTSEYWPETGDELAEVVTQASRGIGAPVIGTNLVGMISNGPWTGWVYGGNSIAADASGEIMVKCKDRDRDIKVVAIKIE